jgi:hypothetical protein
MTDVAPVQAPGQAPALDLTPLQNTVTVAGAARRQELQAYYAARSSQDLDGMQAHYQAYQAALTTEQKAAEVLGGNVLNTPEAAHDLDLLGQANQRLSDAAAALKADSAALTRFTDAANLVLQILGALAAF